MGMCDDMPPGVICEDFSGSPVAPQGATPGPSESIGMAEKVAKAILDYDWIGHWKLIVGILIGLWILKHFLYRDKLLAQARTIMFTAPGWIVFFWKSFIVLGIYYAPKFLGLSFSIKTFLGVK